MILRSVQQVFCNSSVASGSEEKVALLYSGLREMGSHSFNGYY